MALSSSDNRRLERCLVCPHQGPAHGRLVGAYLQAGVLWSSSVPDLQGNGTVMDRLTLFGLFVVTAILVCSALEGRSPWFVLAFAGSCALGSLYGLLQGAWPFGMVEAI